MQITVQKAKQTTTWWIYFWLSNMCSYVCLQMPNIVGYALLLLHLGSCMVTWYVWYIHPCMEVVKTKSLKRRW